MRERWRLGRVKIACLLLFGYVTSVLANQSECKHGGHRFVHDYIQFQCSANEKLQLEAKPIGCVPTNVSTGAVILPGLSFTGEHFRYSCNKQSDNTLALKITHCVDNAGAVVALGEYFMQRNEKGEHVSMECIGNEENAKKVVFKWSKCRRKNGEQLTEGNFVTEKLANETPNKYYLVSAKGLKFVLQLKSCLPSEFRVNLQCTGCVAVNGVHIGVSSYANVHGQWTQCRRYEEQCRLINVTNDYVNCKYEGRSYENGETFKSRSGHSSYICDFGIVTKQGCLIGEELIGVGEVRYVNGAAQACEHKDGLVDLGILKGCRLEDGSMRKFMDTWTDDEQVKRRCSWSTDSKGRAFSEIVDYACLHKDEEVPLNKVIQLSDGQLLKCAVGDANRLLAMRSLKPHEQDEYLKRKTMRLNLVEYYASGAKSASPIKEHVLRAPSEARQPFEESACKDYLPFCGRLSNYCSALPETGLLIEAYEEHARMQEAFERLSGARHDPRKPFGCENQLASFRKVQVIVELACQKTCRKCFQNAQRERVVSNLEQTAHCG